MAADSTSSVSENATHEAFALVTRLLAELGHPHPPRWLDVPARTCQEAAEALGLATGQIDRRVEMEEAGDRVGAFSSRTNMPWFAKSKCVRFGT